ncbi:MAG: hypothetical protein AB1817_19225, partial [Chloroflexota bacterium]
MSASAPQLTPTQPHPRNLLELYRQHRDEIDVLTDDTSLFLLGFIQQIGTVRAGELSRELNLPMAELSKKLQRLTRAQLIATGAAGLTATAMGARLLQEIGFLGLPPVSPGEPPKKPEPPPQPKRPEPPALAKPKPTGFNPVLVLGAIGAMGFVAVITTVLVIAWWALSEQPPEIPTLALPTAAPVLPTRVLPPTVLPTPTTRLPLATATASAPRQCVLRLIPGSLTGGEIPVTFEASSGCPDGIGEITARYEDRSAPYKMFPPFTIRAGS